MKEFNTKVVEGDYFITFETDDRKAFEQVQNLCRLLVDGKDGEAIPIEWIRNEIASSIAVVRDNDYDYTYASCILQLLERWEKENGRD